jgi:hypothetical protein
MRMLKKTRMDGRSEGLSQGRRSAAGTATAANARQHCQTLAVGNEAHEQRTSAWAYVFRGQSAKVRECRPECSRAVDLETAAQRFRKHEGQSTAEGKPNGNAACVTSKPRAHCAAAGT